MYAWLSFWLQTEHLRFLALDTRTPPGLAKLILTQKTANDNNQKLQGSLPGVLQTRFYTARFDARRQRGAQTVRFSHRSRKRTSELWRDPSQLALTKTEGPR